MNLYTPTTETANGFDQPPFPDANMDALAGQAELDARNLNEEKRMNETDSLGTYRNLPDENLVPMQSEETVAEIICGCLAKAGTSYTKSGDSSPSNFDSGVAVVCKMPRALGPLQQRLLHTLRRHGREA